MQVTCSLCDFENNINKMFVVHSGGTKTYECSDEKNCKLRQPEKQKKDFENKQKNYSNKLNIFNEKYGVLFEKLEKLPAFRDASTHYYDRKNDRIFTKSMFAAEDDLPELNTNDEYLRKALKFTGAL